MPEGDSIYQDAMRLRPELAGRQVVYADSRWPDRVQGITGQTVRSILTHGKHLLLLLDESVLRIHLRMKGRWKVLDKRARPVHEGLGLLLVTTRSACACFWPELEHIDRRALAIHPLLSSLGPDLLQPPIDFTEVLRRARSDPDRAIAETLLDQRVSAGIGNVYKSEVLFAERIHPLTPTSEVSDEKLLALYERAAKWLWKNRETRVRNTTGQPAPNLWVYGGKHRCLRCGSTLKSEKHGIHQRVTWWCPRCQR